MIHPRKRPGAAKGADARLYAVGSGDDPKTAEAYDPIQGTWSNIASMASARDELAVAAGSDGRVYALGGKDSSGALASVEAYSVKSDRWLPVAPMSRPCDFCVAGVGLDGRIYVFGGFYTDGAGVLQLPNDVIGYGPLIAADPKVASPGAPILVTGANFAANAHVAFRLGAASTPVAMVATDAVGTLVQPAQLIMPLGSAGDVVITAVDDRSAYAVRTIVRSVP